MAATSSSSAEMPTSSASVGSVTNAAAPPVAPSPTINPARTLRRMWPAVIATKRRSARLNGDHERDQFDRHDDRQHPRRHAMRHATGEAGPAVPGKAEEQTRSKT